MKAEKGLFGGSRSKLDILLIASIEAIKIQLTLNLTSQRFCCESCWKFDVVLTYRRSQLNEIKSLAISM